MQKQTSGLSSPHVLRAYTDAVCSRWMIVEGPVQPSDRLQVLVRNLHCITCCNAPSQVSGLAGLCLLAAPWSGGHAAVAATASASPHRHHHRRVQLAGNLERPGPGANRRFHWRMFNLLSAPYQVCLLSWQQPSTGCSALQHWSCLMVR